MHLEIIIAIVCLFALAPAVVAQEGVRKALPYPVWPIPQEAEISDARLLLADAVIVVPDGDREAQYPGRLLSELIADHFMAVVPVVVGSAPEGKTPIVVGQIGDKLVADAARSAGLKITAADPGPEGYALKVDDKGAVIAGCDYRGALYGVSTFDQLVHQWGHQSAAVRHATIRDWPFLPVRWVHVYIPGKEALPYARRYMRDFLLRYKYNGLIMEVGGGMRFDSHPELSVGWRRTVSEWYAHGETMDKFGEGIPLGAANRFAASCHFGVAGGSYIEKDDLAHLAEVAQMYGLEIIPEIQSLSHVYYIASARRDLAEIPDMPWPDSYCPSNPESYKIMFDITDEYVEVLKAKRVHIGHDEYRAGAFCPLCKGKDEGELYARDVLKIYEHLKAKGIEVWMWGDHFVDWHNRFGRAWSEGSVVSYEKPDTASARDIVAAAAADIHITNWSGEKGDETFKALGWPFVLGNFSGRREKDWPARVERSGLIGAEVSSWCALDEFEMGKMNIPEAAFSINLLWSSHYPPKEDALDQTARLMPVIRGMLAAKAPASTHATPMRFTVIDIQSACNSPAKGDSWDLSAVPVGRTFSNGIPYQIVDPAVNLGNSCVLVARRKGDIPSEVSLPVTGRWASLVFVQSATEKGADSIHAGDATHFPRESSELIGFYRIQYADGMVDSYGIRYDETVARWDAGLATPYYFTRALAAGTLPDGHTAVLWASEWTNPRPDVPIVSVTLCGAPGPSGSNPILFGVTGVEKPRVEDYR